MIVKNESGSDNNCVIICNFASPKLKEKNEFPFEVGVCLVIW